MKPWSMGWISLVVLGDKHITSMFSYHCIWPLDSQGIIQKQKMLAGQVSATMALERLGHYPTVKDIGWTSFCNYGQGIIQQQKILAGQVFATTALERPGHYPTAKDIGWTSFSNYGPGTARALSNSKRYWLDKFQQLWPWNGQGIIQQ